MFVVRALRDLVGRNLVQPYSILTGTELLAEVVSHEDYARSTVCQGLIGADWPVGKVVLRLFGERFANGEALVVGVEGEDWKVVPGRNK